jgi:hypothetical protein
MMGMQAALSAASDRANKTSSGTRRPVVLRSQQSTMSAIRNPRSTFAMPQTTRWLIR